MKNWIAIFVTFTLSTFAAASYAQPPKDASFEKTKQSGILVVGMDPSELPWVKKDNATGRYEGFEYELMSLVAKKMGLKLKVVETHWSQLVQELLMNQFDIIANAYSDDGVENILKSSIAWSAPYYSWGWAIAVRADDKSINGIGDLKGKIVGCFTDGKDYFSRINGVKELKIYKHAAYDDLLEKKIDAFMYDSPSVFYNVKINPKIRVAGPIIEKNKTYNLGFRSKDESLKKAVNDALESTINSPEWKNILTRWQAITE